jgi:tripartite-type tricarboxylate transporter receptor subunit TctC
VSYASWGVGSTSHLTMELLLKATGLEALHAPFTGQAPGITAVIGGQVDCMFLTAGGAEAASRDGRVKLLAVSAAERMALLPDVPTLREAGTDEDVLASTYFALALPAGTPRAVAQRLHQEMKGALSARDVAERLNNAGLEPTGGTGEELLELVKRDIPRFRRLIEEIGIQPE